MRDEYPEKPGLYVIGALVAATLFQLGTEPHTGPDVQRSLNIEENQLSAEICSRFSLQPQDSQLYSSLEKSTSQIALNAATLTITTAASYDTIREEELPFATVSVINNQENSELDGKKVIYIDMDEYRSFTAATPKLPLVGERTVTTQTGTYAFKPPGDPNDFFNKLNAPSLPSSEFIYAIVDPRLDKENTASQSAGGIDDSKTFYNVEPCIWDNITHGEITKEDPIWLSSNTNQSDVARWSGTDVMVFIGGKTTPMQPVSYAAIQSNAHIEPLANVQEKLNQLPSPVKESVHSAFEEKWNETTKKFRDTNGSTKFQEAEKARRTQLENLIKKI